MWSRWLYLKGPEGLRVNIEIKKKALAGAFSVEASNEDLVSVATHNAQECEQVGKDVIDI